MTLYEVFLGLLMVGVSVYFTRRWLPPVLVALGFFAGTLGFDQLSSLSQAKQDSTAVLPIMLIPVVLVLAAVLLLTGGALTVIALIQRIRRMPR